MYGCLQEQAALREQLQGLNVRLSAAEQAQRATEDRAQQEQAQKQAAMQVCSTPFSCLLPCFATPLCYCVTLSPASDKAHAFQIPGTCKLPLQGYCIELPFRLRCDHVVI